VAWLCGSPLVLFYLQLEVCAGRDKLAGDLGLNSSFSDGPLISQLLQRPATSAAPAATTAAPSLSTGTTSNTFSRSMQDPLSAPVFSTALDGDRQPFSSANHDSDSLVSSLAPHAHRDSSNNVLKSEEDELAKPEDSLRKDGVEDHEGGRGISNNIHEGGGGGGGSQLGGEEVAKTEDIRLGNGRGGPGGSGTQASGGSGPPKSRSISMSPRNSAHNGTNGEELVHLVRVEFCLKSS